MTELRHTEIWHYSYTRVGCWKHPQTKHFVAELLYLCYIYLQILVNTQGRIQDPTMTSLLVQKEVIYAISMYTLLDIRLQCASRTCMYYFENSRITNLAAQAWFDWRFKNHWFRTRVVCTHFNQHSNLQTTVNRILLTFVGKLSSLVHHSYHSKQVCTLSQWFLDLLPKPKGMPNWHLEQEYHECFAELAAKAGFGRWFKNHWLPNSVVCTPEWFYAGCQSLDSK